jgi:hypothetical protein
MGMACQLGKEPAENLQAQSRHLRTYLQAATRRALGDPRPDPDRLREKLLGNPRAEWRSPDAIPALLQLLQAEDKPVRLVLVDVLAKINHRRSTQALAMRAMVDLSAEVREAALQALRDRPREDYRDLLLGGLYYPWMPVQQHAAEALVALKDKQAIAELARTLDLPPATIPFQVTQGKKKLLVTRELVRVNHLLNCALCHAPSFQRGDLVRGSIPSKDRALPPPGTVPYYGGSGQVIRADITYLRQDFSVIQPVLKTAPKWPTHQRFDYLVRTRPLTPRERKLFEKEKLDRVVRQLREPALFALRELTGKDLGSDPSKWRRLATMSKPPSAGADKPSLKDRVAGDWTQFLLLREIAIADGSKEASASQLAKELPTASRVEQERLIGLLMDGKGAEFTNALAAVIPNLEGECRGKAREALADRLTRMKDATLRQYLKDDNAEVRRAAALAVAQKDSKSLIPDLIGLVSDSSPLVQRAAHAALKALSGKDFGPRSGADSTEQVKAAAAWRAWWKMQTPE